MGKVTTSLNVHGMLRCSFADVRNVTCTLREASVTRPLIWFGTDSDVMMQLDQATVRELLPYLQSFVDVGLLSDPTRDPNYPDKGNDDRLPDRTHFG